MSRRACLTLLLAALPIAGCASPDVLAPSIERQLSAPAPAVVRNRVTTAPETGTMLARVTMVPTNNSDGRVGGDIYELRFSYRGGYNDAHIEPRYTYKKGYPPPVLINEEVLDARMRDGSNDYIHLHICLRTYVLYSVGAGCVGDDWERDYSFVPSDNGREVVVPYRYQSGDNCGDDCYARNGDFHITLTWIPVNIQPVRVNVYPKGWFTLSAGDILAREVVAEAYDANDQMIPGLPVTWSSADLSVFTINAEGDAKPVGLGTAAAIATVSGISSSFNVTVLPTISLSVTGPSAVRRSTSCQFSASLTTAGLTIPLTYAWTGPGGQTGSGPFFRPLITSSGAVTVTVTDAAGKMGRAARSVSVSSSAPLCR